MVCYSLCCVVWCVHGMDVSVPVCVVCICVHVCMCVYTSVQVIVV